MAVKVKVTKNLKGIPVRVNQMTKLGQYALVNQVHADSNQYAPMRPASGQLRGESRVTPDNKQIIWNVPYARRQYYAPGGWKYSTPGTGPKWDQKAKAIHLDSWIRVAKRAMK